MTPKQKRFVDEYLVDLNASAAAIRAGYEKRSAAGTVCRLLAAGGEVSAAIVDAKRKREIRTNLNQDYVLNAWKTVIDTCLTAEKWDPKAVCHASGMLAKHLNMVSGDNEVNVGNIIVSLNMYLHNDHRK
jgi:phage terminase small subunit